MQESVNLDMKFKGLGKITSVNNFGRKDCGQFYD